MKYKVEENELFDIEKLKESIEGKGMKPYLENDTHMSGSIEGIPTLNRDNYQSLLGQRDVTVIEVFSKKCPGCKRIDPLMPSLKERLQKDNIQLARIDVLNEVGFLKNIEKTPTFLVYSRKRKAFKIVDTASQQAPEEDDDSEILLTKLNDLIKETVKTI